MSKVTRRVNVEEEISSISNGYCITRKSGSYIYHYFYFSEETNSLDDIFGSNLNDGFKRYLYIIDLTEFDITVVTSFKNAFSNSPNLQRIIFPTKIMTKPKDVTEMLKDCTSLTSVDLSMFDLTDCENFNDMINGCNALKTLILRDFYFKNESVVSNIFFPELNLEYLDIYDAKGATETIQNYVAISDSLKVCQSKYIIPQKLQICCNNDCKLNFIEIYYKEDCNYENGFKSNSNYRQIDFVLKYNDDIYENTTPFSISKGDKLEIYFSQEPTSLEKFFSETEDPNMKYVYSIDLSNLVSTSLTNINSLFNQTSSIESITFNCDLSSVTDMSNLFNGCSSLKALYLLNFTISNGTETTDMFKDVNELSYLDIRQLNDEKNAIIENLLKKIQNLIVCKNENLDFTSDNFKYICCDYNTTIDRCYSSNYISIQYENSTEIAGFGNNNRNELLFLMIKNQTHDLIETFTVNENEKLELHFTSPIDSLENFFNADSFKTAGKIKSVDFSNFDSSEVKSLSNLFKGCSSLKILDLSGFNMNTMTNIENTFQELTSLGYIILQDFTISNSFTEEIEKENGLNQLNKKLYVCQDENKKILTNGNYKTICCNYSTEKEMCDSDNYIVVNYNKAINYNSDFLNDYRNNINFINTEQGTIFLDKEALNFEGEIEIHLNSNITSLNNFFNYEIDNNVGEIISIDFTNFDASLIKEMDSTFKGCKALKSINFSKINTSSLISMNSTFSGCESLESVDLPYFDTSAVTDMRNLLSNCKNLKEIDLSNFETSNVVNMDNMFAGCTNIEYIDISSFNMVKIQSATDMFNGINDIKYINLENVHNSKEYISGSPLNALNDLLVSQKEIILGGDKIKNMGCYYNITSHQCESSNYIIIYYAVDTEYKDGFENQFRENIDFIIAEDRNKKIAPTESFSIVKGNKIEIYYKDITIIKSLQSYFDSNKDENVINIKSVDLTHLKISLENTDLSSLFNGCILLESVYLSNLNTANVTNMNSMFTNCKSLKLIDLSNFDTSKVTNMDSMFSNCTSIEYIDIYPFNMEQVNSAESMFDNVENLKYINIYHINDPNEKINGSYLNGKTDIIICQENKILDFDNITCKCCNYDMNNRNCEIGNYMTIYYGNDTEYINGFANEYRTDIKYIIGYNRDVELMSNQPFKITGGNKIEIYFSSNLKSLQNFFFSEVDENAKNIISVDLSQLVSLEICL